MKDIFNLIHSEELRDKYIVLIYFRVYFTYTTRTQTANKSHSNLV